jgi:hypothetical protein
MERAMKVMNISVIKRVMLLSILLLAACEDTEKALLPNKSEFVGPFMISPATLPATVFTPEDEGDEYETFKWEVSDYGLQVSVRYEIQIDSDEDFSSPVTLTAVEGNLDKSIREAKVTVKMMNDKMLELGLPGFQESTVYVRVRSVMNGVANTPLYSNMISRTATTYQTSECGTYCTVGLIGSASPGGWDNDTDMRLLDPTGVDKRTWTITVFLTGGNEVKFRAMDSWDVNWGAPDYPTGTGVTNGQNIPIPTDGYYKVIFNDDTGEYSFTPVTATYTTVGIIGDGVGGWGDGDEIALTQDANDPHVWTGTITFSAADVKFRADAAWAVNWGSDTYPSGYAVGNGPNVPIATGGTYFVWFNDASGEYLIGPAANSAPYNAVGLIGPATPNSWDGPDLDIYKNPGNAFKWSRVVTLAEGMAKFRADDDWAVNWGASAFPSGVGVQGGADIGVMAGTYFVTFNTLTGQYYFLK